MQTHNGYRAMFLSLIMALAGASASEAEVVDLGTLHRQILEIVHGEPRTDVIPSPYYCFRNGLGPKEPTLEDRRWYIYGPGQCNVIYIPNLASIEASYPNLKGNRFLRLEDSLTKLADLLQTTPLSLGDRFDLQMTLWELIGSLKLNMRMRLWLDYDIASSKGDHLFVLALRALQATLFSRDQIEALPATLPQLAALSGDPGIDLLARQLVNGDETILEDLFPSQMHGHSTENRLFSRVFITIDDPAELERFRAELNQQANLRLEGFSWQSAPPLAREQQSPRPDRGLDTVPAYYSRAHTILLLFFNVLDTSYNVVPTKMVAAWQEMEYSGKAERPHDLRNGRYLRALDPLLRLRIINYQKQLGLKTSDGKQKGTGFPVYRKLSEDEMSGSFSQEITATGRYTNVTTNRGRCFFCHQGNLGTWGRVMRKAGFAKPFAVPSTELYDRNREVETGQLLKAWSLEYLAKTHEPKTAKPAAPGAQTPP